MAITKPDMEFIWASGGSIVEPSDTKKQTGWTAEVPPHQWENWIQNRQDTYLAHINERGIPEWDGFTNYLASGLSYVQGSDGKIYKSVAASGPATTIQDPTTDVSDTYWTVAFADVGAFISQAQGDARYLQILNNLSDLNNAATARTNLGVYSTTEVNNFGINSVRIDVASASTVNLTVNAPNTRNINITGTTTITAFTVAAGQLYFVRFNASLTLTNNANIVTQSGANIVTSAGATCILRATSANVVEVLAYTPHGGWANSLTANGWQKLPSGLIIQWGQGLAAIGGTIITFPLSFPSAVLQIIASGANNNDVPVNAYFPTTSQFTADALAGVGGPYSFNWLALGY